MPSDGSAMKIVLITLVASLALFIFIIRRERSPARTSLGKTPASERTPRIVKQAPAKTAHSNPATTATFLTEASAGNNSASNIVMDGQPEANGNRRLEDIIAVTENSQGEFLSPVWAPDSSSLFVVRKDSSQLLRVYLQGTAVTRAEEVSPSDAPWLEMGEDERGNPVARRKTTNDFSEDGEAAGAFIRDDKVYFRDKPGSAPRTLAEGDDIFTTAVTSPDGKQVAYLSPHTGLYIQSISEGSEASSQTPQAVDPEWLPDSSGVLFRWYRMDENGKPAAGDIYLVTVTGGIISNLTNTPDQAEGDSAVSPDSSRIAFELNGKILVGRLK